MYIAMDKTYIVILLLWTVEYSQSQPVTPRDDNCNNDGDLRLVHKQGNNFGALQVCDSEYGWRYIVKRDWTERAARLACMELGLPYLNVTTSTLRLSMRVPTREMQSCSCVEQAQQLNDCIIYKEYSNIIITLNCTNGHHLKEECSANTVSATDKCTNESIRLVGGASYREGRVEVCVDGRWGTVCGEGYSNENAGNVCSRLGYSLTNAIMSFYGEGTGPVYTIPCNASDCQFISNTQCDHSQDLGVKCESYTDACEAEIKELSTESFNNGTIDTLGALLGLSVITLAAVLAGWIMTYVYFHRKINKQTKDHTSQHSQGDPALQQQNPAYNTGFPSQHTTYSSLGPSYETNQEAEHSYDVINRPHPPTTLPGPDHEYSALENPAHTPGGGVRVVEGAYSLVGESDPQNYEVPTTTTKGGQEYSKLQH